MRAGELDTKILIQEPMRSQAPDGSAVTEWRDVASPWCGIKEMRASERRQADQVMPARTASMVIRYRSDLHQAMRILYDGLAWKITGIAPIGRKVSLEITAEAVGT